MACPIRRTGATGLTGDEERFAEIDCRDVVVIFLLVALPESTFGDDLFDGEFQLEHQSQIVRLPQKGRVNIVTPPVWSG